MNNQIRKLAKITHLDESYVYESIDKLVSSLGLESVDLARLRSSLTPTPSFQQLLGTPLREVLASMQNEAQGEPVLSYIDAIQSPVLDIQQSYLIGENEGCPCVVYSEFNISGLELKSFWNALDSIVKNEPMLHAQIQDETRQGIPSIEQWSSVVHKVYNVSNFEKHRNKLLDQFHSQKNRYWDISISQVDNTMRLHLIINMLFMDATSVVTLCNRMTSAYKCSLEGRNIETSLKKPLFLQYVQEKFEHYPSEKTIALWRERVADYPKAPQLPRKSHKDHQGVPSFKRETRSLSTPRWSMLKELARRQGVTVNSILLSAFSEVIRLYSENTEFTLTVTRSNRPAIQAFENVVGEFTNVILCPIWDDRLSIVNRASQINGVLNFAIEQEDITGLDTVRILREVQCDPHINFPIVFTSFLGIIERLQPLENTTISLVHQQTQTPQLSLDHQVYESDGTLITNWDFDEYVFESSVIVEMIDCFIEVLNGLAENKYYETSLPEKIQYLREETNQTNRIHGYEKSKPTLLHELVQQQYKLRPKATALIDQDKEFTYAQVMELATAIASELQNRGIKKEEPVAIIQEKGWEQIVSTLGVLMAGGSYLPLNPSHPDDHLRSIIQVAKCRFALVQEKTLVEGGNARIWNHTDDSSIIEIIIVDEQFKSAFKFTPIHIESNQRAYIIFTSGSTGAPKGVEINHYGAVNTCLDINERFGLGQKTVTFGISSLGFDLSVWDIFGTLGAGGVLVVCKPTGTIDPDYWWEQVIKNQVTMWNTVPTSFEMLVHSKPDNVDMPIRSVLLSGDAISINMVQYAGELFPDLQINALGGATEASIWSNYHVVSKETFRMGTDLVPYGRPLSNQTIMVLDNQLRYRPNGVVGEIYIGGSGVAIGYFEAPEITSEKFFESQTFGRIYQTGDLGRYLSNGEIEIIGRKDSQVKVGGHRVELAEIERCAEEIQGVNRASVLYISGAGARVVGFYIGKTEETKVREFVKGRLPDYMAPSTWIKLDSIPLTPNSKVDMKQLRLLAQSYHSNTSNIEKINDSDVKVIMEKVAQVLRIPISTISTTQSLVEQGLTSLYAIQLVNLLSQEYKTKLSYTLLFNYPTVAKLSAYLSTDKSVDRKNNHNKAQTRINEPIAIIATACRLPKNVTSANELGHQLFEKIDAFSDVPKNRFDVNLIYTEHMGLDGTTYVRKGSFIDQIDGFDNELFGISKAEVNHMDPQQRVMMEVAYEVITNAGFTMDELAGSNTGVFIGQMNYDWMMDFDHSKEYAGTGSAPSITSNRISYVFDFHGPSITIDTACSSSLVAVDTAVERLRKGDCSLAIAGGVNLILSPEPYVFTCQSRMLSPNQRCATFDETADGIIRGEGVGAVLLKRLTDAERDDDPILAVIHGSAVNQDGRSASLTAPNGLAQEQLYRNALKDAGKNGGDLDYLECHGTGTALGDPIEVESIKAVMSENRSLPIVLGALKTNLGHLEGAAGITGLIKVTEVLQRKSVPPNLHFNRLNPKINLLGLNAVIPTERVDIKLDRPMVAGVSSFGYGGTNAHVILESYDKGKVKMKNPNVWLFSDQGSLHSGLINDLYKRNADFRASLKVNLAIVQTHINTSFLCGYNLLDIILSSNNETKEVLRKTQVQQPALVAVQLAQVDMWTRRGLKPGIVLGYSIGELSAAVVLGVLLVEEALTLAVRRGEMMGNCQPGCMVEVDESIDVLNSSLSQYTTISAMNGYKQTVIASTDKKTLFINQNYIDRVTTLPVSHAFHSPMMISAAEAFVEELSNYTLRIPVNDIEFISTLSNKVDAQEITSPKYWGKQMVSAVNFLGAIEVLKEKLVGNEVMIEFGASPTLLNLSRTLLEEKPRIRFLHSIDTAQGVPSLVQLRQKTFKWTPPLPKNPIQSISVPTNYTQSYPPIDLDWLTQETWELIHITPSLITGPVVVLSPIIQSGFPSTWNIIQINGFTDYSSLCDSHSHIVYICGLGQDDIFCLLQVFQSIPKQKNMSEMLVIIPESLRTQCGGIDGLCRTANLELGIPVKILEAPSTQISKAAPVALVTSQEILKVDKDGNWYEKIFNPLSYKNYYPSRNITSEGIYIITGGMGELGQQAVVTLYENGARELVLLGRTNLGELTSQLETLRSRLPNSHIRYFECDITDESSIQKLVESLSALPEVKGLIHTAGALDDSLIENQTASKFRKVIGVKQQGAQLLHCYLKPTDFIILYSSIAARFGSFGQSNYCAANSALDNLVAEFIHAGVTTTSIQWGIWSEIGMAHRAGLVDKLAKEGFGIVTPAQGNTILGFILNHEIPGVISASPIKESEQNLLNRKEVAKSSFVKSSEWSREKVFNVVEDSLQQFFDQKILTDLPFMEAGLSSLDLVQFRQALLNRLPQTVNIPPQFVFNYPTVDDIVEHLSEQLNALDEEFEQESVLPPLQVQFEWQKLNDVNDGEPLFLIGGVIGNINKTFGPLAEELKMPVYGVMPEIAWNIDSTTLQEVATNLLSALKLQHPRANYWLGGLSFGATLAIEIGSQLECNSMATLSGLVLLDPRHMAPFQAPENAAPFEQLVEGHRPNKKVKAPAYWYRSTIPPVETQSDMMRDVSRSFQSDKVIKQCCQSVLEDIRERSASGHHFNFLYKHHCSLASQINNDLISIAPSSLEPIAIVSTACRLPGNVDSRQNFWEMLNDGKDYISSVPLTRFDIDAIFDKDPDQIGKSYTRMGGFIETAEYFDYELFGISEAEAKVMDPQQRVLLEVVHQALSEAGYDRKSLKGSDTAVFIGLANDDWTSMGREEEAHNPYFGAGVSSSIASNRISYLYGLNGPSMTIDTACSSSLVAIDLAVEKLRNKLCSKAIVGGVNIIAHRRMFISACATKALSFKGRCATFDISADGYCRGEGAGAVVLKRLSDAIADQDNVLAVIQGTAVNQDGRSVSMTAPSGVAQEAVISKALKNASIEPSQVDYVECHGTGTPLGDPIELGSLQNVLLKDRKKPLVVGSVKSNIGHLEGAAGIVGLIKAVEVVQHRSSPGIVHFNQINPNILIENDLLIVTTESVALPSEGIITAGVSSFGFGGTNAHVVLTSYQNTNMKQYPVPCFNRKYLPWRTLPNPLLSRNIDGAVGASLNNRHAELWQEHAIHGNSIVPGASHITMLAGGHYLSNISASAIAINVKDILLLAPAYVEPDNDIVCRHQNSEWKVEIGKNTEWATVAIAKESQILHTINVQNLPNLDEIRSRCLRVDHKNMYTLLGNQGMQFGEKYQLIDELWISPEEGLARIRVKGLSGIEKSLSLIAPSILDAGIQLLGLTSVEKSGLCIPFAVEEATLLLIDKQPEDVWAYTRIYSASDEHIKGDVWLFAEDNKCIANIKGLDCRPWQESNPVQQHLYDTTWTFFEKGTLVANERALMMHTSSQVFSNELNSFSTVMINDASDIERIVNGDNNKLAWLIDKSKNELLLTLIQMLNRVQRSIQLLILIPQMEHMDYSVTAFMRTVRKENSLLNIHCIHGDYRDLFQLLEDNIVIPAEPDIKIDKLGLSVSRLKHAKQSNDAIKVHPNKTYVVSGGLGALGFAATEFLVSEGATHIVLLSRQITNSHSLIELKKRAHIKVLACDVSDEDQVANSSKQLAEDDWPIVAGVIHTVGVLTDAMLENQTEKHFEKAFAAKVEGAKHLRSILCPSDFLIMYSSAASVFGSAGQSSYASANGQLDDLAIEWEKTDQASVLSIQWGAWSDIGMAVRQGAVDRAHEVGYGSISTKQGKAILKFLLDKGYRGVVCACPVDWRRMEDRSPFFSNLKPQLEFENQLSSEAPILLTEAWTELDIRQVVRNVAKKAIGKTVDDGQSLMANGLDSLSGVVLAQELSQAFGVTLGTIFSINHPTIDEMVLELMLQAPKRLTEPSTTIMSPKDINESKVETYKSETESGIDNKLIAIVSTACRLPGQVNNAADFWQVLESRMDLVSEIPKSRFDIDEVYDADVNALGTSYTKKGGFIEGAEYFDHEFFGISEIEAQAMDPHQRLMLQTGYQAFHNLGYSKSDLKGANIGVFVGVSNQDWMVTKGEEQAHNPYFGSGVSFSIISNRISYALGLIGPSMTLDTACSSSLVALDIAVSKLQNRDCDAALVGGVNVMMHHRTFVGSCAANMLSKEGRCASFDQDADGYCRGEGVGVVILKRLSDAKADGDEILAVINGTAVNQDGASATMTAPSGKAQQEVLRKAYEKAGILPSNVDYVECHGTGTPLGDPIEVDALKRVLGENRSKTLVLGSAKSNLGHLEGAAGIVGLIKAVEVLRHRRAPGLAHFKKLNANINIHNFDVCIQASAKDLPQKGRLFAGVSSFGFGGTNAHVVISSYGSKASTLQTSLMGYKKTFLPWRTLPNPLLSRPIEEGFGATLYGEFAELWQDHRIQDQVIVPAASHVSMLAGRQLLTSPSGQEGISIKDIVFLRPAVVDGLQEIKCVSSANGSNICIGNSFSWHTVAEAGRIHDLHQPEYFDKSYDDIVSVCDRQDYNNLYQSMEKYGAQFGPSYRNICDLFIGNDEGVASIEITLMNPLLESVTLLVPEAIDAGIQLLSLCGQSSTSVLVPYSLREARLYSVTQQPTQLRSYARITERSEGQFTGDVWIFSNDGECFAVLKGLVCRAWKQVDPVKENIYQVSWKDPSQPIQTLISQKTGLLMTLEVDNYTLPSKWTHEYIASFKRLKNSDVNIVAFDLRSTRIDLFDILNLLKTVSEEQPAAHLMLILSHEDKLHQSVQAMVKSVQAESLDLKIQTVLMSKSTPISEFFNLPWLPKESTIQLTSLGEWEIARLTQFESDSQAEQPIRAEATYVISGGLGALGQITAQYLVEKGATHIVLIGRKQLINEWSNTWEEIRSQAKIEYRTCDVSDQEQVRTVAAELDKHWPEIAGVFHTAGILTDGIVQNQSASNLESAMAVKAQGAQNLMSQCKPIDFMVLYSSASAIFGSPGQTTYAASNAAMEALANQWNDQDEVPVLNIQWGAWDGAGMATRTGAVEKSIAAGFGSISATLGMQTLHFLLSRKVRGSVCVCPFDWDRFYLNDPIFSEFVETQLIEPNSEEVTAATLDWNESELINLVRKTVHKTMGKQVNDDDLLMSHGLDSLNGVALAQNLGRVLDLNLGAIFTINYPTINDMVFELKSLISKRVVKNDERGSKPDIESKVVLAPIQECNNKSLKEPIAIVSVACRLPGGIEDSDSLWDMLMQKPELMREVPSHRFSLDPYYDPDPQAIGKTYTKYGSFLDEVDSFDHEFFGIPIVEARSMDPQQRQLLEVSCEAFYRAGYDMDSLKSKPIGVFVGQMSHDWAHMHGDKMLHDPYFGAGSAASITSNRMSYLFGITGPSMTLDTACSSSLVALDLAVSKLRENVCNAALVGGVNLMLSHRSFIGCCAANMLSREGRCASFDENADGYSRGEGIGAVVVKRLSDAIADGNEILAVIKGTAVNQDGRSASLTAPNSLAQQQVINEALTEAGYKGKDLDFVECHGTGTPLGDPIEIAALKKVTQAGRTKPLAIGTIKSNIGHLEGAAGIISLIKAVEVVQRRVSPGLAHFKQLNSNIDLLNCDLVISDQPTKLAEDKVIGGVSSFGFGGTNAHIILESYGKPKSLSNDSSASISSLPNREIIMLFTGQGSLQSGALTKLCQSEPYFKQALVHYCDLLEKEGVYILDPLLVKSNENTQFLTPTRVQQPAMVALQLAMLDFWQQKGIKPSKVIGHSIGEFAAAVSAGVMSASDALKLSIVRGRAMDNCETGSMAALLMARASIGELPEGIVCAAENGPLLTVLAGSSDILSDWLDEKYPGQYIALPVSHAFHSQMMEPARQEVTNYLSDYSLQPALKVQFFSTLSGQLETERLTRPDYWGEQMVKTVKYRQAVESLFQVSSKKMTVIEIGPSNTLINMAQRMVNSSDINWIETADPAVVNSL